MSDVVRAIARGAWREAWNQGWRFSRVKLGLLLLVGQLGIALLFLWRLQPAPAPSPLLPMAGVTLAVLLSAFVMGLLRGRSQLYGRTVLRVQHVSPASGVSILGGLVLAGLPQRAFSSVAVAVVVALLMPAGALWWTLPLFWALALISSLVGYAAALLALVGWVRIEPRSLAVMWGIAMGMGLSIAYLLLFLVLWGGPVSALVPVLEQVTPWLAGIIGGLVGIPGLVMALWVVRRPEGAGEWYRDAYMRMQELSDGRRGMRASRWPRVLAGPAGALQAGQWRQIWLNWFTWVRLAGSLLVIVTLAWKGGNMVRVTAQSRDLPVLVFGLLAALGAFGELAGTVGGSDGPNIGLGMVAGVRARDVVKAKWLTAVPIALLSAVCTWGAGAALGGGSLSLSLIAGLIGLGFGVVAIGGGLCDLDPHAEVTEREVPEVLRAMLEQAPLKMGALAGTVVAILFACVAVWLCHRAASAAVPIAFGMALLAHLGLLPGYLHLRRLGM